jgi:signal peptidase I
MWPTLNPEVQTVPWGDILLVWHWNYQPRVGDVVCAYSPHHPYRQVVKRVIALGPALVIPYTRTSQSPQSSNAPTFESIPSSSPTTELRSVSTMNEADIDVSPSSSVVVPRGYVWLEGDHHWASLDSNDYGPLPVGFISGHATRVLIPHAHFRKRFLQPLSPVLPPGHSYVQKLTSQY